MPRHTVSLQLDSALILEHYRSMQPLQNTSIKRVIRSQAMMFDLSDADIASALNRKKNWISRRMTGKTPWIIDDLAGVASVIGLTTSELIQKAEEEVAG